jgi:hypothetical protein
MKEEMLSWLLTVERYNVHDAYNRWGSDAEARKALWSAEESLRILHGIQFVATRGHPYERHRGSPAELERRGLRFVRKARIKGLRAEETLRLAALQSDTEEAERIGALADRQATRNAFARRGRS